MREFNVLMIILYAMLFVFYGFLIAFAIIVNDSWLLAGFYAVLGAIILTASTYPYWKEWVMNLGIYERIRERRRLEAAAAVAERYKDKDLFDTPEAREIPPAEYRCSSESCYRSNPSDDMYWVDSPSVTLGWYCDRCCDLMRDMDKAERLNMGVFLTVLDYEARRLDKVE